MKKSTKKSKHEIVESIHFISPLDEYLRSVLLGIGIDLKRVFSSALDNYLNQKFPKINTSPLCIELRTIEQLESNFKVLKDKSIKIRRTHKFKVTDPVLFLLLIDRLNRISYLLESHGKLKPIEEQNKSYYSQNVIGYKKLLGIIMNMKYPHELDNTHELPIGQITFKTKKETIRICDSSIIYNILILLKESAEKHQKLEWPQYVKMGKLRTSIIKETAKIVHHFLIDYSNLPRTKKKKTSDSICRVVYDLLLDENIIKEEDFPNSIPEDYIRTLILRCDTI